MYRRYRVSEVLALPVLHDGFVTSHLPVVLRIHTLLFAAPDPAFHFDVDPDPAF
jgi:hypothetical protein